MKAITLCAMLCLMAAILLVDGSSADEDLFDQGDRLFLISSKLRCLKCTTRFFKDDFCCQRGRSACCGGGHHGVVGGGVIQVPVMPVAHPQPHQPIVHQPIMPVVHPQPYQPIVHQPVMPVVHPVSVVYQPVVHKPVMPVVQPVQYQPIVHKPVMPVVQPVQYQPIVHKPVMPVVHPEPVVYQPIVHKPQPIVIKPYPIQHGVGVVGYPKPCRCGAPGLHFRSGSTGAGTYSSSSTPQPATTVPSPAEEYMSTVTGRYP